MRIAVLQHVPFEGPAAIADWAAARGTEIAVTHLYRNEPLPALADFDMLAVMGGPMSANDEARYTWLTPEIALVGSAIHAGKIVLGVCLGAQIIAKALGAKVYAARQKEIGWFEVERTEAAHPIFQGLPAAFPAFHWHGETFDLPAGAVRLAETASTPNQAFGVNGRVLGLQFHIEATPASVADLVQNAADEIGTGPFEQSPDAIRESIGTCASLQPLIGCVLNNLTRVAGEGK
ncbi:MAG: type 1 glutamine amidotransferase [Rhodomicrobium sp.]